MRMCKELLPGSQLAAYLEPQVSVLEAGAGPMPEHLVLWSAPQRALPHLQQVPPVAAALPHGRYGDGQLLPALSLLLWPLDAHSTSAKHAVYLTLASAAAYSWLGTGC